MCHDSDVDLTVATLNGGFFEFDWGSLQCSPTTKFKKRRNFSVNSIFFKTQMNSDPDQTCVSRIIHYYSLQWDKDSLCCGCGPAAPSALPAPRWHLRQSAPSLQQCADSAQCSGWRCSEPQCPGGARLSGTAGVSAQVGERNTVSLAQVLIKSWSTYFKLQKCWGTSLFARGVHTYTLLVLGWIDTTR